MAANEQIIASPVESSRWKRLARAGWYGCALITLGIFLLSVPALIVAAEEHFSRSQAAPEPSLLLSAMIIASFLAFTAAALISVILASALFLKRPEDGMALFSAYFLLVYGVVLAGPLASFEYLWPGARMFVWSVLQPVILVPLLIAFLSIFPNARFVPSWTRWLVVLSMLYATLTPLLYHEFASPELTTLSFARALVWFALIFSGLYAQIHRYRYVSGPTERQQTKWVLYGLVLALLLMFLLSLASFMPERLLPEGASPWLAPIGGLGWSLAIVALPISLTSAVMRYRLYDIDLIINRTLVYGALTACIAAVYVLVVGGLGVLLQTEGSLLVSLMATGLVAVLFQPLRERLQRAVNRLTFGERDEPFEALARLGRRLESTFSPEMVYPTIVETVAQALKLPYAAIVLKRGERFEIAETYGSVSQEPVAYSLNHQGEVVGRLLVGRRSPDEDFSPADERLLRNFARQVGTAVHAVQLTADLQRSRQQLVTAREEERRRLRRDLHDGLGPALASVAWQVDSARDLVHMDPSGALELLDGSIQQAQDALSDIRRLVYGLRPPALDELGLVGALEQAAQQQRQTAVAIDAPGRLPPLPAAVEVAAYRIVQEALRNAVEHGRAAHCVVRLAVDDGLRLTIRDDGSGVPASVSPGVGLLSMRERAEELGGAFTIGPGQAGGTEVDVSLPLA